MNIQRIIIGLIATALFSTSLLAATAKRGEVATPMNAVQTFEKKQCVRCHLIDARWDAYGPDLARTSLSGNFSDIVGRMWNKAPVMLTKMNELGIEFPTLQSDDLVRVASFIGVYQNMLGDYVENADVEHGATLFHGNGCGSCHISKRMQGTFRSPLAALDALWKHGRSVRSKGEGSQVTWKRMRKADVKDFLSFLTDQASQDGESVPERYLAPGDSWLGKQWFAELQCSSCHNNDVNANHRKGESYGMESNSRLEIGSVLTAFWNHSPRMWRVSGKSTSEPDVNSQTLADLVAYWYGVRFERYKDDTVLGALLFETRSCASCHEVGSDDLVIPEKRDELLAQMWSHVPEMVEACLDQDIDWPIMQNGEISAIAEYLVQTKH